MLLQATLGNENFPTGSSKVFLFHTPTTRHAGKGKEVNIYSCDLAQRQGQSVTVPAAPRYIDKFGKWTTTSFDVPEGIILKIYGQRKAEWLSERIIGQMFIQPREGAAYRRVGAILTGWEHAAFTHANIEGRFDILTMPEAAAQGATIPGHFVKYFTDRWTSRMFEITTVDGEIEARQMIGTDTVINTRGEEVEVRAPRRGRAIDL